MCTPQALPSPITWASPTLAPSIWRGPRLAAQVGADLPDVGDAGRRDRVALGLQTTRDVDRGLPVPPGGPAVEEVDRAALLAQHEVVVVHELGGREAVVQLDEVEVLGTDAGLLVGLRGRVAGQGVDVGQDLAGLLPRVGREDRGRDLDGPPTLLGRERLQLRVRSRPRRRRPRHSSPSTSAGCSGRRS